MSYVHGKWETIFKRKKEIEARYLRIRTAKMMIEAPSHNIPRQINHIAFPNLIALYLGTPSLKKSRTRLPRLSAS